MGMAALTNARAPRRSYKRTSVQINSKFWLGITGWIALGGSAVFWWDVQRTLLPGEDWRLKLVAGVMTVIMVLAPPGLLTFLIPWTPAGMLLSKTRSHTWGQLVVVGCLLYLLYVSGNMQWVWWAGHLGENIDLAPWQMLLGNVGFIAIPALTWNAVSDDELVEQVKQAHLVKRYELQVNADIAILRATMIRVQSYADRGYGNLSDKERQEYAAIIRGLAGGIDRTLKEIHGTVRAVIGYEMPYGDLDEEAGVGDALELVTDQLLLPPGPEARAALAEHPVYQQLISGAQAEREMAAHAKAPPEGRTRAVAPGEPTPRQIMDQAVDAIITGRLGK
jgi:hypothetical protein